MADDLMELMTSVLFTVAAIGLIGLLAFGVMEVVQVVRARPAQYACLDRNLEPERLALSARVACRSRQTGADTLNINHVRP